MGRGKRKHEYRAALTKPGERVAVVDFVFRRKHFGCSGLARRPRGLQLLALPHLLAEKGLVLFGEVRERGQVERGRCVLLEPPHQWPHFADAGEEPASLGTGRHEVEDEY